MKKTKKPLILVTNDDGITSPGIEALVEVMKTLGDVVVVAPRVRNREVQQLIEHDPVRQPRQAIVSGQVLDSVFVPFAPGDVLADAAIALEDAGGIEHGFAADAYPDLLAGFVQPAQLQVMERLVRIENRHMR